MRRCGRKEVGMEQDGSWDALEASLQRKEFLPVLWCPKPGQGPASKRVREKD